MPARIEDVAHLEEMLSEPTAQAFETLTRLDGDLLILGVAGKMGPTLARMARRAFDLAGVRRRVIGVARFSTPHVEQQLRAWGIETVACDLLDPEALARLPDAANVLVMVGMKFGLQAGAPIDLRMGQLNAIWQADANAAALAAFAHAASPPLIVNIAGPELLSVRRLAEQFAGLFGRPATFEGGEAADALLSNGQLGHRLFGYPRVGVAQLIDWTVDWLCRGGATLDKPTHFDVRDGKF
jgi:nucleoside-diphosphate-sugar epimerase